MYQRYECGYTTMEKCAEPGCGTDFSILRYINNIVVNSTMGYLIAYNLFFKSVHVIKNCDLESDSN